MSISMLATGNKTIEKQKQEEKHNIESGPGYIFLYTAEQTDQHKTSNMSCNT